MDEDTLVRCLSGNGGKAGIGLIVLALLFWVMAVLPQQRILQTLQDKVRSMQPTRSDTRNGAVLNDTQALQLFYDFLPQSDSSLLDQ